MKRVPDILFLCGFMGSGKSTVGRALAKELGLSFADLDEMIEEKAGKSIAQIFADSGEDSFRKRERDLLLETVITFKGVLALGGGSLQSRRLSDILKTRGLLIFIETPLSVILDRISKDKERPLLLNEKGVPKNRGTLRRELHKLYQQRLPFYKQADITLKDKGEKNAGELVQGLIKKINEYVSSY